MAVQYFDSVQPHGLRVWDQPARGTSVRRPPEAKKKEKGSNKSYHQKVHLLTYLPYCLGIVT